MTLGALDKVFDRLPTSAKVTFVVLTIIGGVYCIVRYGFFSFVLHVIFSP
jgi:hypothetical protein